MIRRLAVLAALYACCPIQAGAQQQQPAAPAVVVKAAELRAVARESEFIGRIEATEFVDIKPRVSGILAAPKFRDGERVTAGQLLYVIEKDQYQAALDAKVAQLSSARADAQNAELAFDRAQELLRTNAGTRATLDQRKAELAKAEAAVKMAEAAVTDAKITLGYTDIHAPIAGRIGRTAITEGNLVTPSTGSLVTIVKDDRMRAVFSVSQRELLAYRKARTTKEPIITLKLADGSIYNQNGVIDYIDNAVDSRTDGLVLRATFPNPDGLLLHGQTVRVLIAQPAENKQVVVPQVALAADQSGSFVLVVDGENKVSVRYVKIDRLHDDVAVVTDGIKEGETVIVQGMQRVRPGMKVNPQRAAAGN